MTSDISMALDRVWHNGLLHKLKNYGVPIWIFDPILTNRIMNIILNGYVSRSILINERGPQESILRRTLFLIFIHGLSDTIFMLMIQLFNSLLIVDPIASTK